jgi:DNA polymerase-3 subunit gamma/tau
LIDEVHMLSQSSFNALLKTLEEPPEHVKFLFATTDPQKLPVTILSRCLQFNLKNMSPERIVGHLQNILGQEQVSFEDMALWALARAADGSMRDALSLTDQAIAYGNHSLTETGVSAMLGTVDQKKIYRILDCLISRNAAQMLQEISALAEFSPNYASVLATIAEILHRVAIEQAVPGACDNSMGDQEQVVAYARQLCAEDVQLFYQVALVSRKDLAITPDPKSGLEMALLRMLAFQLSPNDQTGPSIVTEGGADSVSSENQPVLETAPTSEYISENPAPISEPVSTESIAAQANLDAPTEPSSEFVTEQNVSSEELSKKKTPLNSDVRNAVENAVEIKTASPHEHRDEVEVQHVDLKSESIQVDKVGEVALEVASLNDEKCASSEHLSQSVCETDSTHEKEAVSTSENNLAADVHSSGWNKQVTQLGLSGMTLNLILNSVLEEGADGLRLYFEAGHSRLLNPSHEKRIREALDSHLAQGRNIEFIEGLNPGQETPMMWRERVKAEMLARAKASVESDPYVQQMIKDFDGVLVENSIQSLGQII